MKHTKKRIIKMTGYVLLAGTLIGGSFMLGRLTESENKPQNFERASTEVLPEDNPVCYYTLLSVQEEPVEIHVVEGGRG